MICRRVGGTALQSQHPTTAQQRPQHGHLRGRQRCRRIAEHVCACCWIPATRKEKCGTGTGRKVPSPGRVLLCCSHSLQGPVVRHPPRRQREHNSTICIMPQGCSWFWMSWCTKESGVRSRNQPCLEGAAMRTSAGLTSQDVHENPIRGYTALQGDSDRSYRQ